MKKYTYICSFVLICVVLFLFTSCGSEQDKRDMDDMSYEKYEMDDMKTLEDNITREYNLNELRAFFEGSNENERIGFGITAPALTFSEVNDKFLVEILRTGGYSVYKVSQGGYFYVFWVESFAEETEPSNGTLSAYFSAYLSSDRSLNLFDSLTPGISTANDVQKIDPSFELSFLRSSGIFSYSYINDETILEIEYTFQGDISGYDDLIVKELRIVARDSAPTRYSALLSSDLP